MRKFGIFKCLIECTKSSHAFVRDNTNTKKKESKTEKENKLLVNKIGTRFLERTRTQFKLSCA